MQIAIVRSDGVAKIWDTITGAELVSLKGDKKDFALVSSVLYSLDGSRIAIIDSKSHNVLSFVLTGKRPWSVDLSADEKTAIVANGLSDDITVVDMVSMQPVQSLPIGRIPHTVVIDD